MIFYNINEFKLNLFYFILLKNIKKYLLIHINLFIYKSFLVKK